MRPLIIRGAYFGSWPENADINADGRMDSRDINPFVELLTGQAVRHLPWSAASAAGAVSWV
jgi:hypothetical protein